MVLARSPKRQGICVCFFPILRAVVCTDHTGVSCTVPLSAWNEGFPFHSNSGVVPVSLASFPYRYGTGTIPHRYFSGISGLILFFFLLFLNADLFIGEGGIAFLTVTPIQAEMLTFSNLQTWRTGRAVWFTVFPPSPQCRH